MLFTVSTVLAYLAFAAASPLEHFPRAVKSLNEQATAEAHQRDDGATRAFSNVQIKTSDGKCLFVDKLSGDFRANLTPIQVGDCGSTDGQGWDFITSGTHNNVPGSTLVVNTLTQACFNFDPRRATGNQVLLFSCGGRADGSGRVTNSQLFAFNGSTGPLSFEPENAQGSCLAVKGNVIDIANCQAGNASQSFSIGGAAGGTAAANPGSGGNAGQTATSGAARNGKPKATAAPQVTRGPVPATPTTPPVDSNEGVAAIANPTDAVPVSRAGGTLNPTAVAESQQRDNTATRAFSNVEIRASNGKCLFVDPTAGDFRQNLIPVSLVECSGTPNEKWDVITSGKHNNAQGAAILVSSLMNGCVSVDGRRAAGDTVTMFSCGGRADGEGETNSGQTFPFDGQQTTFEFAPRSDDGRVCVTPGSERLESGPCPTDGTQLFSIVQ